MTEVLRWVRALTLAAVLLVSGVGGHVAADGRTPALGLLAALFLLAAVALAPLLEAPASAVRVAALLVAGQALLHVVLVLAAAATEPAGHAGMAMAGSEHAPTGSAHLGMLLAHLGAALVVASWLAAGERAVWTLLALTARPVVEALRVLVDALLSGTATVLGPVRPAPTPAYVVLPARSAAWAGSGVSRRGPPSRVLA